MPEIQVYAEVRNQNATEIGSSIEIQTEYEFGKDPIILWSFSPDQEGVSLHVERENLSTGNFEADESIDVWDKLKYTISLDPDKKTRVYLEVTDPNQNVISLSNYLVFNSLSTIAQANNPAPNQAALKYEITTTISESYFTMEYGARSGLDIDTDLHHYFNDESKYKTIRYSDQTYDVFSPEDGNPKGFIYQSSSSEDNLSGFFYPACISEILPCITLIPASGVNSKQVKLSWKIIDDFFDYKFLSNQLRVETNSLEVSVQYKDNNNVYQNIKQNIFLTKEKNYVSNFFEIVLEKNDIESSVVGLFDKISLRDNNSNNLKIKIESHNVTFTTPLRNDTKSFEGNLLLPPKWTHILYDQHRDTNVDTEDDILKINLNAHSLRGIVLPEAGFKKNIHIKNWNLQAANRGSYIQSTKISYKLTAEAKALYLDPIREGTIVYVQLPSSGLDDVFLIPPTLMLPKPNIDPNGKLAEGEVVLDEYGKISGIKMTDPGFGYSMFKTESDKRDQTFVDYLPVVRSKFHVQSSNVDITKETLIPQNDSFSRLKASLEGGVKLNQPNGNTLSVLNPEQETILKEYLDRTGADTSAEGDSETNNPYINKNNNSSNNVTIKSIDLEWYNISKLYADKSNDALEDLEIYNLSTDADISSVEDSTVKDEIEPAEVALDISNTDITEDGQLRKTGESSAFSLNFLPIFTDASAASSVFNPNAGPPWLTLLPLDKRSDGAAGYGALPNMLTRGDSFFNRIVDGINNLNQVRLMLPSIWAIDKVETRDKWLRDSTGSTEPAELVTFQKQGEFTSNTKIDSYVIPSNGRGVGARVLRSVKKTNDGILSLELNQSMNITPMIHPWMEQAIPDFFTRSFNRKYLAFEVGRTEVCDSFMPYQENGVGVLNGCGTSVEIGPNISVPDGRIVTTSARLRFFNGGGISLQPYGSAVSLAFPYGNGFCNTFSCASQTDLDFDFRYSNLYPAILNIPS